MHLNFNRLAWSFLKIDNYLFHRFAQVESPKTVYNGQKPAILVNVNIAAKISRIRHKVPPIIFVK